jgi:hypothetical protein
LGGRVKKNFYYISDISDYLYNILGGLVTVKILSMLLFDSQKPIKQLSQTIIFYKILISNAVPLGEYRRFPMELSFDTFRFLKPSRTSTTPNQRRLFTV